VGASAHLGLRFRVRGTAGLRSAPGRFCALPFQLRKWVRGSGVLCVGLEIAARRIRDPAGHV